MRVKLIPFVVIYFRMDQIRRCTPNKIKCRDGSLINSPRLHTTPIKQSEISLQRAACQNSTGCFTVLPNYFTPPSGLARVVRRNPFETDLINRLHLPVISPTVFTKVTLLVEKKLHASIMFH